MNLIRLTLTSILLCGFLYVGTVFGFARTFFPEKAAGSLVADASGKIIGSSLIAQAFGSDRYFHPRPSACDYNAQGACGSNLSPTNPELRVRAEGIIAATGVDAGRPIPADLVTASGSGLDPDITRAAAMFQIGRIAKARELPSATLEGRLPAGPILNVLELNLALDKMTR